MDAIEELAAEIMARAEALAAVSESAEGLTRRSYTAEHRTANDLVAGWMRAAGMTVREDAIGNLIGRLEGIRTDAPALLIGSHLDTVADAGRYDGMLGVLTGIACVQALQAAGRRLDFPVEVIGFADEEGTRFQATYLGSRAAAGRFDRRLLERRDRDGITLGDALLGFGLDPSRIAEAARDPEDLLGYLELHIEQGPVLEAERLPVGAVTAIAGQSRLAVTLRGEAGHAGTVPMALRRDALAGAAACLLQVEAVCREAAPVVGTVGSLSVAPGASNVVPGQVRFTLDLRAAEDDARTAALETVRQRIETIARERNLALAMETVHEAASVPCAGWLSAHIEASITAGGWRLHRLPSGAGHDAAAMASVTDIGMIFVRCRDGVSHNPAESITEADAAAGLRVLLATVQSLPASRPERRGAERPWS